MIVIDNAFSPCHVSWPKTGWVEYGNKQASDLATPIPVDCAKLLARMALLPVAQWLPSLPPIVPDMGLYGSGLHQMPPGSWLDWHLDSDTHGRLGLARVLSAVLWVHPRWDDDWGGELCLESGITVLPKPGRLAIFDCREAWHSVAKITGPAQRRSLAMFWWSLDAGAGKRLRASFDAGKQFSVPESEKWPNN